MPGPDIDNNNNNDKKRSYPYPNDDIVKITINVTGRVLNQWKEKIQDRIGNQNRSSVIKTAMRIYEMFLDGHLTGQSSEEIINELVEIKSFLSSLKDSLSTLIAEKYSELKQIEEELPDGEIPNYIEYKEEIIRVLTEDGPQSVYSLPLFMDMKKRIQGPFLFQVLQRMKTENLVFINRMHGWELMMKDGE